MGNTYRDLEHAGCYRYMRTMSTRRQSCRALDELREADFRGNYSRLRQQTARGSSFCPEQWDEFPVAGHREGNRGGSDDVEIWYPGGRSLLLKVKEAFFYLESLRAMGITTVEVTWTDSHAVLTYRSGSYWGSSWTLDGETGRAPWGSFEGKLDPSRWPRYRHRESLPDLSNLLRKPSASTVNFLRHRTLGLVELHQFISEPDKIKASDLTGAVVQLGNSIYTLDREQVTLVFGTRTRKGRITFTFWYEKDGARVRFHFN